MKYFLKIKKTRKKNKNKKNKNFLINLKNIIEYNLSNGKKLKEKEEADICRDQVDDKVDHMYQ
jgi:hypothetical protein